MALHSPYGSYSRSMKYMLALCLATCMANAQTNVVVPMPVLFGAPQDRLRIYVDTAGSDTGEGSVDRPVKTWARAHALLKERTADRTGRVPCAVRYNAGRHRLTEPILQRTPDRVIDGPAGRRWLEISIEGADSTTLDGTNAVVPPGHGLISLCGSGITIERLRVYNSPAFGIRLSDPGSRSTNVLLYRVIVDSTVSHGIKIGDADSPQSDTTALIECRVRQTNLSNDGGTAPQFGSAIKLFGARDVTIKNCGLERNWGEAIGINNSQRVDVSDTWVLDNWGIGVYCDIAADVRVHGCLFRSTADTAVFKPNKRGMVGILCSNEAYTAFVTDYRCERIDVFNNIFLGLSGSLDLWEGAVSFLQRGYINDVRFAHNTCVGLRSGRDDINVAFVNLVHSEVVTVNRFFARIHVANNVFAGDATTYPVARWVRVPEIDRGAVTFVNNRWNTLVPPVGTEQGNDVEPTLPSAEGGNLWPEVTPAFKRTVRSLEGIDEDARNMPRGRDSTNVGAFEHPVTSSVRTSTVDRAAITWIAVHGASCDIAPSDVVRRADVFTADGRCIASYRLLPGQSSIAWGQEASVFVTIIRETP